MPLRLSIVTPERPVVDAEVERVVAPGAEGEFGVLPAHEAFLTALRPGVVRYAQDGREARVAVSSGFAEVTGERATLLVRSAEPAEEIDRGRAEEARARAEAALQQAGHEAPAAELAALRENLQRAEARLAAAAH